VKTNSAAEERWFRTR